MRGGLLLGVIRLAEAIHQAYVSIQTLCGRSKYFRDLDTLSTKKKLPLPERKKNEKIVQISL